MLFIIYIIVFFFLLIILCLIFLFSEDSELILRIKEQIEKTFENFKSDVLGIKKSPSITFQQMQDYFTDYDDSLMAYYDKNEQLWYILPYMLETFNFSGSELKNHWVIYTFFIERDVRLSSIFPHKGEKDFISKADFIKENGLEKYNFQLFIKWVHFKKENSNVTLSKLNQHSKYLIINTTKDIFPKFYYMGLSAYIKKEMLGNPNYMFTKEYNLHKKEIQALIEEGELPIDEILAKFFDEKFIEKLGPYNLEELCSEWLRNELEAFQEYENLFSFQKIFYKKYYHKQK